MLGILYALITVFAWGTWLAPSQRVPLKNQQVRMFYLAAVNLAVASAISWSRGSAGLTWLQFWPPFAGGLVWAASGLCAFTATARLGMAKAFGIWAPLNILVSLVCGRVLFGEFRQPGALKLLLLGVAVVVIIAGVLLIVFAKGETGGPSGGRALTVGLLGALGAGVLWGVYYLPIQLSGVSLWVAAWPMALGIFAGSLGLLLLGRESPKLARAGDYARVGATGCLWTVGNYGMLLLVGHLGAGKGFTIAQLSLVVNALVGIYWLKEPGPGTPAARMTLLGCVLATAGGILLGNLK